MIFFWNTPCANIADATHTRRSLFGMVIRDKYRRSATNMVTRMIFDEEKGNIFKRHRKHHYVTSHSGTILGFGSPRNEQ